MHSVVLHRVAFSPSPSAFRFTPLRPTLRASSHFLQAPTGKRTMHYGRGRTCMPCRFALCLRFFLTHFRFLSFRFLCLLPACYAPILCSAFWLLVLFVALPVADPHVPDSLLLFTFLLPVLLILSPSCCRCRTLLPFPFAIDSTHLRHTSSSPGIYVVPPNFCSPRRSPFIAALDTSCRVT